MTAPRHTEEIASEMTQDLTLQLLRLIGGEPTDAELEEALALLPQLATVIKTRLSARHLKTAHEAARKGLVSFVPVTATPKQLAAGVHPHFGALLAPFSKRDSA